MKGLNVICPSCNGNYHVTTDSYDPEKQATGDMCELKEPWKGHGWCLYGDGGTCIAQDATAKDTITHVFMECVRCCNPLAPNGKLTIQEPERAPEKEPETNKGTILRLRGEGLSYGEIAKETGLSTSYIGTVVRAATAEKSND